MKNKDENMFFSRLTIINGEQFFLVTWKLIYLDHSTFRKISKIY